MKNPKPNVTRTQITQARRLDLLTYLRRYAPQELVRLSTSTYSMRSHDSLKISNGKWYRWSTGQGGSNALDYLVTVEGMDFVRAVQMLCEETDHAPPPPTFKAKPLTRKPLKLPPPNDDNRRVIRYLMSRGIDEALIHACIKSGRLYEDTRHNCVFVGFGPDRSPRFAFVRSSSPASTFMHEAEGSDKQFCFSLTFDKSSTTLKVCESAIDALSHATLERSRGAKLHNYIALSGLYQPRKELTDTPLPVALARYLEERPDTQWIDLCFDNDRAGEMAAQTIIALIGQRYDVRYTPPEHGKDYNRMLMDERGLSGIRTREASCPKRNEKDRGAR